MMKKNKMDYNIHIIKSNKRFEIRNNIDRL